MLFAKQIDFMGIRKPAMIISGVLIVLSLASLFINKLNVGIDFTGGSVIEVGYPSSVDLEPIRNALASAGFDDAIVQHFGSASEVLIRLVPRAEQLEAELNSEIEKGIIRPISVGDLLMTIVSLNIMAFMGAPMFKVMTGISDKQYQKFLKQRKMENVRLVLKSLEPEVES